MARITQMTPFIQTHNLRASLAFFKDIMGFECTFRADNCLFFFGQPTPHPARSA